MGFAKIKLTVTSDLYIFSPNLKKNIEGVVVLFFVPKCSLIYSGLFSPITVRGSPESKQNLLLNLLRKIGMLLKMLMFSQSMMNLSVAALGSNIELRCFWAGSVDFSSGYTAKS